MTKHTQGEWGIATIDCGAADDEIVSEVNGCMVNIAAVFGAGEYSEARPGEELEPRYEVGKEEAAANARLLAAAPDLLEALRAAVSSAEGVARRNHSEEPFWTLEARAAIAKAMGE